MSQDTYPGSAGSLLSLNRYTYVLNSPTLTADPSGMTPNNNVLQPKSCYDTTEKNQWWCQTPLAGPCFAAGCTLLAGILKNLGNGGIDDVDGEIARLETTAAQGDTGAQRVLRAISYLSRENIATFELPITRDRTPMKADVVLKNGNVVEVGGYSKTFNPDHFGQQIAALAKYA